MSFNSQRFFLMSKFLVQMKCNVQSLAAPFNQRRLIERERELNYRNISHSIYSLSPNLSLVFFYSESFKKSSQPLVDGLQPCLPIFPSKGKMQIFSACNILQTSHSFSQALSSPLHVGIIIPIYCVHWSKQPEGFSLLKFTFKINTFIQSPTEGFNCLPFSSEAAKWMVASEDDYSSFFSSLPETKSCYQ